MFVGGCTLEAAEAICGSQELRIEDRGSKIADSSSILYPLSSILDGLGTLVENSLLRQVDGMDGESRFAMLETLREYARERLAEQADERALRQRHAAYYLALAERAEPETLGISQAVSLGYLEDEHDNLRAALSWVIEQRATETALRFGAALERFWWVHGHLSEGRRWLSAVLALPGQAGDDTQAEKVARAWSLRGAGRLAHMQGDYEQANACYAASLALQRELADKAGIAAVLSGQGHVALRLGDYRTARLRFEESLAIQRELGSQRGIADALGNLASVARLQGDHAQAGSLGAERLALVRDLGNRRDLALALANIGHVAIEQGDYERAKSCYKQSLPIFRELNERGNIAILLGNLGVVARGQGDAQLAKQRCTESLALFRELGDRRGAAIALGYLGDTLLSEHHVAGARAYYTESLEIYRSLNERLGIADRLESMAAVCVAAGDHERAARLWGAAEALRADIGTPLWPANRAGYDRAVAEARAQLGEEPFAAAWAAGRALRLEQVIAEALE